MSIDKEQRTKIVLRIAAACLGGTAGFLLCNSLIEPPPPHDTSYRLLWMILFPVTALTGMTIAPVLSLILIVVMAIYRFRGVRNKVTKWSVSVPVFFVTSFFLASWLTVYLNQDRIRYDLALAFTFVTEGLNIMPADVVCSDRTVNADVLAQAKADTTDKRLFERKDPLSEKDYITARIRSIATNLMPLLTADQDTNSGPVAYAIEGSGSNPIVGEDLKDLIVNKKSQGDKDKRKMDVPKTTAALEKFMLEHPPLIPDAKGYWTRDASAQSPVSFDLTKYFGDQYPQYCQSFAQHKSAPTSK